MTMRHQVRTRMGDTSVLVLALGATVVAAGAADGQVTLLGVAGVLWAWLAYRLAARLIRSAGRFRFSDLRHGDAGTVITEFALVGPIVFFAFGSTIQLALLANASLMVRYAAFAAARSAIVGIERSIDFSDYPPVDWNWNIDSLPPKARTRATTAARLAVASISPRMTPTGDVEPANLVLAMLKANPGPWGDKHFVDRFAYTGVALTVDFELENMDYELDIFGVGGVSVPNTIAPKAVAATVHYEFKLAIPGIASISALTNEAPGGVGGRSFTISKTSTLQSTGTRNSGLLPLVYELNPFTGDLLGFVP